MYKIPLNHPSVGPTIPMIHGGWDENLGQILFQSRCKLCGIPIDQNRPAMDEPVIGRQCPSCKEWRALELTGRKSSIP